MTASDNTTLLEDEQTAIALRKVGIPVSEAMSEKESARAHALQVQAAMRKLSLENEKALKGLYTDWVFNALNLNRFR